MRRIYTTPGTRVTWHDLASWIRAAHQLDRRRLSRARNRALGVHGGCLPRAVIDAETDIEVIDAALDLLKYGPTHLARPSRGYRGNHPTTPVIVDLSNRRAQLLRQENIPEGANWIAVHGYGNP